LSAAALNSRFLHIYNFFKIVWKSYFSDDTQPESFLCPALIVRDYDPQQQVNQQARNASRQQRKQECQPEPDWADAKEFS